MHAHSSAHGRMSRGVHACACPCARPQEWGRSRVRALVPVHTTARIMTQRPARTGACPAVLLRVREGYGVPRCNTNPPRATSMEIYIPGGQGWGLPHSNKCVCLEDLARCLGLADLAELVRPGGLAECVQPRALQLWESGSAPRSPAVGNTPRSV
eukprot:366265-Chlamydomonas_euryale.AAC.3